MDVFDMATMSNNIFIIFIIALPAIIVLGLHKRCYKETFLLVFIPIAWLCAAKICIKMDFIFLFWILIPVFFIGCIFIVALFFAIINAKSRKEQDNEFVHYYTRFYYDDPNKYSDDEIYECLCYAVSVGDKKLFSHVLLSLPEIRRANITQRTKEGL